MAFAVDGRRALVGGALAVASSAVLLWFAAGLHPLWPLLWIAPLPVLVFATRASWRAVMLVAALAWLLGRFNLWHYLHDVLHIPLAEIAVLFAVQALIFSLAVLRYRALLRRGAHVLALVAFPATWVVFEYIVNLISPHGTAWSLAYTQLELLPFLQLASITGPWGLTFLVLAFPAALAAAWHLRATRARALWIVGAAAGVLAVVLVFGAVRLATGAGEPTVKVGLVASDPPVSPRVADEGAPTAALFDQYARTAAALAARGAQVVVLPEKLGVTVDPDTKDSDARFQALADSSHAVIVVGLIRVSPTPPKVKYNEARIYAPGAPVASYDKHHMLPPFELQFAPGTSLGRVPGEPTWGVAICKDMDFTPLSRDYGRAGIGMMLVPAWDFVVDDVWHGHMAVMRGVESGFSVVRAAKQGLLTVSDSRGRIVAEQASDASPFATLLADVPASHGETLYLRFGDWFAWLVVAGLVVTLVQLVRRWRVRSS